MIKTEDLTKKFEDFMAVDSVDLEVGDGEVLALLGPNGAGKTTTVRMLTSILRPTRGRAFVAGYNVATEAKKVRSSVGVLTENHGLYNRMKAEEYLDFYGQIYNMEPVERQKRYKKLLGDFGLQEATGKRIGEFSKGMRQKLALARALLHNPPALLLDEPTSAMDPESARLVRDLIKDLRSSERTIIICTHNLAEAEELADRIAIIRRGQIIAKGSPDELKDQLLGPPLYEVRFAEALNGQTPAFPETAEVIEKGADWIRYKSEEPKALNPLVVEKMVEQKLKVLSMYEVPRSLERVYLQAVSEEDKRVGYN